MVYVIHLVQTYGRCDNNPQHRTEKEDPQPENRELEVRVQMQIGAI